jgi:hypothetical protein
MGHVYRRCLVPVEPHVGPVRFIVRVEWVKTLPREQAIWEKGMFANQNTGVRLRDQFTLERLIERFGLDRSEGEDF